MKLLDHLTGLSQPASRSGSAANIASLFGADYFFLFILDEEINVLLPGPGFPQTFPNGKLWQPFLQASLHKVHTSILPFPTKEVVYEAFGFPVNHKAIAVFLGGNPDEENLKILNKVLPVVTEVLNLEQKMKVDKTLKEYAQKATGKAEKLMNALDIARHNLQRSLNEQERANEEIRELMGKKDEFMNMASHELKTPVSSIKAYLQIILQYRPDLQQNHPTYTMVEKALKQTDRMVQLINDLLDVNKIQSGQLKLSKTSFNINELINDCIDQELIQTKTHQILKSGDENVVLYADKARIEQVITNLLSNAVKYSPKATQVLIETYVDTQGWFTCKVTDHGIGIPTDAHSAIFDRFFRVDATAHQFSGLGLGLYISAQIIHRHNGNIGVDSTVGEGSTFWFTLPVL